MSTQDTEKGHSAAKRAQRHRAPPSRQLAQRRTAASGMYCWPSKLRIWAIALWMCSRSGFSPAKERHRSGVMEGRRGRRMAALSTAEDGGLCAEACTPERPGVDASPPECLAPCQREQAARQAAFMAPQGPSGQGDQSPSARCALDIDSASIGGRAWGIGPNRRLREVHSTRWAAAGIMWWHAIQTHPCPNIWRPGQAGML